MGGGRGCYAGQPLSFACAKCRKHPLFFDRRDRFGRNWETTGKTRKQLSAGSNYHGWGRIAYQYRCLDCKHVGWSRHPDVERVVRRSQ